MPVINKQLLDGLGIRVFAVAEHPAVPNQKGQRHENAVRPKLPLSAFCVRMPQSTILGPWVGIENFSDVVGAALILWLLRFLIEDQAQIARQHVVERIYWPVDRPLIVDMQIDPRLNMIEI